MRVNRFAIGAIASAVWLLACGVMLYVKRADLAVMTPNSWGDFFAGCFAPLAFLWLVLGYLQQGEELKLSTEALRLQAIELRNSVEQQRELVEVTRDQVASERAALEYERSRYEESLRPNFMIAPAGGFFRGDGVSNYSLVISNAGAMAAKVLGTLNLPSGKKLSLLDLPVFDRGHQHRTSFELPAPLEGTGSSLAIRYSDSLGREHFAIYMVTRESEHPHSSLAFLKIEA